jgi:hypothetical protein
MLGRFRLNLRAKKSVWSERVAGGRISFEFGLNNIGVSSRRIEIN